MKKTILLYLLLVQLAIGIFVLLPEFEKTSNELEYTLISFIVPGLIISFSLKEDSLWTYTKAGLLASLWFTAVFSIAVTTQVWHQGMQLDHFGALLFFFFSSTLLQFIGLYVGALLRDVLNRVGPK